ncbi:MAG TPA: HD domain-containing protein [Acidimicrobiia bacterium]|nr:HD domain-containing protein [Acidimicrobiia bacterium]
MTVLTQRFDDALVFARQRHQTQTRKGTAIPYIAHLLSTAALVLEAGGDEDQAIAGLLHDTLEDREYTEVTYQELTKRFGKRVAGIVRDCSDAEPEPGAEKESWRTRKERYVAGLHHHSLDSLLVSCADKLHNARAILADYRIHREGLWSRFNPDSDQLWYYRSLVNAYRGAGTPLAAELDRVVTELEGLVTAAR